jgi:SAM-dependent methyltransferase/predicted  nucleic acid-binding Zn-ribbon protein
MSSATESAIEPAIVLAAYAEPVASGRRVLFVGPAVSALPARLLERGARLVHVCDPDPLRVAEATAKNRSKEISFSALADGHFALREGAFDVCIVEDAGITDPVALVKKLRRALTPRGVAILASLNPETRVPLLPHRPSGVISLDYYALYDAVKTEFEHVRMLGQAPFVGYVIADFAPDGTPEPSLDTAFLPAGAEEPELFIAVASQQPVELEAFAVVQLPYRSVVSGAVSNDSEALRRSRAETLELRGKLTEAETSLATDRQGLTALRGKLTEAETSLTTDRQGLSALRGKLTEAEAALAADKQALAARDAKLREAETRVFARDAELAALRQELENKNQQLKQQESKLTELNGKLKQGPSAEEAAAAAADLSALEKTLAERGEHIRKLERDLREAERVGKELVRQLPGATPDSAAETRRKAGESELAQKLAKSQADLIATRWALEAAVKRGGASETPEA